MTEEKRGENTSQKPTIFWVMQYSTKYTQIYEAIKETFKDKYDVIIPDDSNDQVSITEKVITQIIDADFVVVDVSTIQYSTPENANEKPRPLFNGNVMLELGIAMSYRKKVIMISSTDLNDLPFDFSSYLVNPCNFNNGAAFIKFIQKLENIIDNPSTRYKNPVVDYDRVYEVITKSELDTLKAQVASNASSSRTFTQTDALSKENQVSLNVVNNSSAPALPAPPSFSRPMLPAPQNIENLTQTDLRLWKEIAQSQDQAVTIKQQSPYSRALQAFNSARLLDVPYQFCELSALEDSVFIDGRRLVYTPIVIDQSLTRLCNAGVLERGEWQGGMRVYPLLVPYDNPDKPSV